MRGLPPAHRYAQYQTVAIEKRSGNLIACIEPESVVLATRQLTALRCLSSALSVITAPSALQVYHRSRFASPHIAS